MKLFEIEDAIAYSSWAAMEMEHQKELLDAEIRLQEAELYLDAVMGGAMVEFSRFEKEIDGRAKAELGTLTEKTAAVACRNYVAAATDSATASGKAVSSNKVHPF